MKIELDVVTHTKTEYEVEFPAFYQEGNNYFAFFDEGNLKRSIGLNDYSISKGIDYNADFRSLNEIVGKATTVKITEKEFQNKLVEILTIINGAINEMRKAHE